MQSFSDCVVKTRNCRPKQKFWPYLGIILPAVTLLSMAVPMTSASAVELDPTVSETALMDKLFENPESLSLNFALLQRQMEAGQFRAAAVTIERLLLLDPDSKLIKILLAEIRFKLGEPIVAELLLSEVIIDPTTPKDMQAQAEEILALVQARRKTNPVRFTVSGGHGRARNARAASRHTQILLADSPITNTTDDKSELFYDYRVAAQYVTELPYQQPQFLRLTGSIATRDFLDYDAGDLTTISTELGYANESGLEAQATATYTTREDKKYAGSAGAVASFQSLLPTGGTATARVSARRNLHFDTPSVANHKLQNGYSVGASGVVTHPVGPLLFGVQFGGSETDAKRRYLSSLSRKTELSVAATIERWVVRVAGSQTVTRFGAPDLAISATRRRDTIGAVDVSINSPVYSFSNGVGLQFEASARASKTRSNIANFSRKVGEVRIGFNLQY